MDEMLLTFEDKMEKTMENLGSEFAAIRAGPRESSSSE